MNFNQYQKKCNETAIFPKSREAALAIIGLGLGGEAGEVQEHVKKIIRDDGCNITEDRKEKIRIELGDVLWYASMLATECGLSLEDIAMANLEKLGRRKEENKLHGSGSER